MCLLKYLIAQMKCADVLSNYKNLILYLPFCSHITGTISLYGIRFECDVSTNLLITNTVEAKESFASTEGFLGTYKGNNDILNCIDKLYNVNNIPFISESAYKTIYIVLYNKNHLLHIASNGDIIPHHIYHHYFDKSYNGSGNKNIYKSKFKRLSKYSSFVSNIDLTLLRYKNVNHKDAYTMDLANIILGLLALYIFTYIFNLTHLMSHITIYMENLAQTLHDILFWLMGIPSGLKLVKPLTSSLGNFFVFHIKLWTDYINLAWPILGNFVMNIKIVSCLGFTYIISLMVDIFTILTLHIYCLYIYATKIYYVVITASLSLFRVFRGKKWNVLRKRVDHATYELDQLFMGTLIFTILIFVLPSILVFYVVFAALRLLILFGYLTLTMFTNLFLNFPIYSILMRFLARDDALHYKRNMYFEELLCDKNCIIMQLKLSRLSYKTIFDSYMDQVSKTLPIIEWKSLLSSLFMGHILNVNFNSCIFKPCKVD